jgi:hypothetical protein
MNNRGVSMCLRFFRDFFFGMVQPSIDNNIWFATSSINNIQGKTIKPTRYIKYYVVV